MGTPYFHLRIGLSICALVSVLSCQSADGAESHSASEPTVVLLEGTPALLIMDGAVGQDLPVSIPETGRYTVTINGETADASTVWIEDYIENKDGRTYDITGPLKLSGIGEVSVDGSPLQAGEHKLRVHSSAPAVVSSVRFELLQKHVDTPTVLSQEMSGAGPWKVVWADEFDGKGAPDASKWTHDLGNWGWGNREPQYYTDGGSGNARQEGGHLIIEARPNDSGHTWTSARLTTRGKVSFLYGRIEMRAKVPAADGTWSAGWLLGDDYRDEVSWPYCGEIDVMEAVGKEIDDASGDGINHGSCHTREFYFKQGNHISEVLEVKDMQGTFHVYAVEWTPEEVRLYLDGTHYYTYNQHGTPEAWPFDSAQNLIFNLAMGGGMGGDIAPDAGAQQLVVDYVRVLSR